MKPESSVQLRLKDFKIQAFDGHGIINDKKNIMRKAGDA